MEDAKKKFIDSLEWTRSIPRDQRQRVTSEWTEDVQGVLDQVRSWIEAAKISDRVDLIDDTVVLTEQGLGKYQVPALNIVLPSMAVAVIPIARNVMGAKGRIDFRSPFASIPLLRIERKTWFFRNVPFLDWSKSMEFNEESFWKVMAWFVE